MKLSYPWITFCCLTLSAFGSGAHGEVFLETGFEGSSALPSGWTQSLIDTSDASWTIQTGGGNGNPSTARSGSYNAFLYYGNSADDKTRLISPIFDADGYASISLTFWHTQQVWASDQDELKVFYSDDGGSNWTQLAHYTTSISAWTKRSIDLPGSSATSQIAFEGNAKWGYGVCLDDILVEGFPATWPEVSVSTTDVVASESGPNIGRWNMTRSGDTSAELTVHYTLGGTAAAGNDYTIDLPSPITFGTGEASLVVTLTPVDDSVFEGEEAESAILTLTQVDGYRIDTADGTIAIADNEPLLSVSVTDSSASESGPDVGTWTITRSINTSGPLTVTYTLSGDATSGSDYTIDVPSPIIFADGEATKNITLTPVDDAVAAEGDEVATLTLEVGSGYEIGNADADISIYDDEGFDLNILVIGSTHSFSEGGEHDVVHEKPFNPTNIATHLESILAQDGVLNKTVKVEFEDIYKSKTNTVRTSRDGINDITARCYSLAQHFFWPDDRAKRLANLRGEDGTKWDCIVVCSDPYIIANFPGMYAEGVKLIQSEFDKTVVPEGEDTPELILMAQWPESSSTFSADDFNEVVHRVGNSAGLTVVPAGKVWDELDTDQDTDSAHPTPKGEYLAAAAIYSKLYGRSASTSGYTYNPPGGDAIADLSLTEVQAIAAASQYSGTYTDINPFQMKDVRKRVVNFRETGTSTEQGLAEALDRLNDVQGISLVRNQGAFWDFNYGRGNDWWEDHKDYEVDPAKHDRAYGFPMHHYYTGSAANAAAQTMPYGIDKYYYGSNYEDGTDLGIAYNMVRPNTRETGLPEGHDVRAIPIRLLWLKMEQAWPGFPPLGDNTHMGPHLNDASAAFMYTLLSGRCPVVDEPATEGSTEWLQWLGHKIGYETAWQMSHLTTRVPGFKVLPSDVSATTVTSTSVETMTVKFLNQPQSNVTVSLSSSNPAVATVSPSSLTFTPSNYNTAQEITVTGITSDTGLQDFDVVFTTSSTDAIFDGLSDAWGYASNTQSIGVGESILLGGFDGNQIQNGVGVATTTSSGVRELVVARQDAGVVRARVWTDQTTEKSLQWQTNNGSTSTGNWGLTDFTTDASTANDAWVITQQAASWINLEVLNISDGDVVLDKFHISARRLHATDSPDTLTISLQQNGTFANPPVLSASDLTATGDATINLNSTTNWEHYEFSFSDILSDSTLSAGETATFRIANSVGTQRLYLDNIAMSGRVTPTGPQLTVSIAPASISEHGGSATATVTRISDTTNALAVTLGSNDESEATVVSGNIPAGQASADFTVTAMDDAVLDGTQTVTITASAVGHADGNATLDITDDEVAPSFTVSYNGNGQSSGTAPANQTKTAGVDLTLVGNSGNLVKTGFTFAGWNTASDGSGTNYAAGATYTDDADLTLSAKWNVQAGSGVITPVSATSTSTIGAPRTLTAAIDGTLLSGGGTSGDILSETVDYAGAAGHWLSASTSIDDDANFRSTTEVLTFTLAEASNVNALHLWPYIRSEQVRGLKTCDISFSTDGGSTYPVTIPSATLGEFTIGPIGGTAPVQSLTFAEQTGVTHIRLANLTTFGSTNYIGISELRFGGSSTGSGSTFADWIGGYELGDQTAFSDDFDKDGLVNGIENYFGTHPGEFTVGLIPGAVDAGEGTFTFTHPLSENPATDIFAAYRWSKNLSDFYYSGESDTEETTVIFAPGTPSGGMVAVTAALNGTPTDKIFVDIEVTQD